MKNTTILLIAFLGVFLFILGSIIGGFQIEDYSHVSQLISESYANGVRNSKYLQYMFIASGLCFFIFGIMVSLQWAKSKSIGMAFVLFAIFYGVGTMLTGFFPCEKGCLFDDKNPSLSQFVHNISGFLTYLIVPFCIILTGVNFRKMTKTMKLGKISLIMGVSSLVFVLLLFGNPQSNVIGLIQRAIELSIHFWVLNVAIHTSRNNLG